MLAAATLPACLGWGLAAFASSEETIPAQPWSLGFTASTGLEFYRGDYGQRDLSDSIRIPIGLSLDWGPLSVGATLPIERAERVDAERCVGAARSFRGPCSRLPNLAQLIGGTTQIESSDEWGPGDLQIDVAASWLPESAPAWLPGLTPFAVLKLPTGDVDDALGTGSIDTTVGLDASWLVWGEVLPFVAGGYTAVEDEEDLGLESYAFASLGASWSPTARFGLTLAYDWRDESAEGESDGHEISPSFWLRIGELVQIEPFGQIGLSPSSPDFGAGVRIRVSP